MMTHHDILNYLEILALAVGAAGGGLWYLTRNEKATHEEDERKYDEMRRYPD
jgi:hypothetical protein